MEKLDEQWFEIGLRVRVRAGSLSMAKARLSVAMIGTKTAKNIEVEVISERAEGEDAKRGD